MQNILEKVDFNNLSVGGGLVLITLFLAIAWVIVTLIKEIFRR